MNNTLPEKIIEEIKKQGIERRPMWRFLLKHSVFWSLAIFSIILGGIAVAVIIFIFIDHDASVRVYLHESIFEDLLQTIPYLWVTTLLTLIGISKYGVRHTKFGYRYTTARIIGVVVASSLILGITLSTLEIGERVQDFLVERLPYYNELTSTSKDAWSHPEKGLLGGTVTAITSSEELKLTDFHEKIWLVDIGKIDTVNNALMRPGIMIKMIGTKEADAEFRAVQVFPWKN